MDANEYQRLAWHTAKPFYKCESGGDTFHQLQLVTLILALAGEAGELANKVKKAIENGEISDTKFRDIFLEELGDVQWYVSGVAHFLGCPLERLMGQNIAKLRERYPNGFPNKSTIGA